MTTTEHTGSKRERLTSKELSALQRRFKQGYRFERTGSGDYRVRARNGRLVEYEGRPIQTSHDPDREALKDVDAKLAKAGVYRGEKLRPPRDGYDAHVRAMRVANEARIERRQVEARQLRDRLQPYVELLGGNDARGALADLARAARELGYQQEFTPDLLAGSLYRVSSLHWVEPRYQEVWNHLVDHLDQADNRVEELFTLIRRSRGLELHPVAALKPMTDNGEWPFRVELISLERCLVDHDYQRPVDWPWVRKTAASFDETLVGTLDVSSRGRGASFAIMDGQGRFEVLKIVGKTSCFASIYEGLDQQAEARFFLHKNQDRKAVHPFHIWKAKMTAHDPETQRIDEIVRQHGYEMSVVSASKLDNKISAVVAVEEAYRRSSERYPNCLEPTLELLHATTFGRQHGQAAMLIKGTARFLQVMPPEKVDLERLRELYADRGPAWLLGRAKEESSHHGAQLRAFVFVVMGEHNRGKTGRDRLTMPALGARGW